MTVVSRPFAGAYATPVVYRSSANDPKAALVARLTNKLILLKKLHARCGYPKQLPEQSRGGACTGIFSFQQMGRSWRSRQ